MQIQVQIYTSLTYEFVPALVGKVESTEMVHAKLKTDVLRVKTTRGNVVFLLHQLDLKTIPIRMSLVVDGSW